MSARTTAFWLLVAICLGTYATMVFWTLAEIARDAGSAALDMRPAGYTAEEARSFLAALSPEGRALYTGPQHLLDLIYPATLAGVVIWSISWAIRGTDAPRVLTALACVAAGVGMAADYLENFRIAGLLAADPATIPDAQIDAASRVSQTKATATTLAMPIWIALLIRRAWRWRTSRG